MAGWGWDGVRDGEKPGIDDARGCCATWCRRFASEALTRKG
jgi:hypothetical protein